MSSQFSLAIRLNPAGFSDVPRCANMQLYPLIGVVDLEIGGVIEAELGVGVRPVRRPERARGLPACQGGLQEPSWEAATEAGDP